MAVTTVGRLLLQDALPEDLHGHGVLDKGGMNKLVAALGAKHPDRYGEILNTVKNLGNQAAFETGTSFTLDDLRPLTELRDAAYAHHATQLRALEKLELESPKLHDDPAHMAKRHALHGAIEQHVTKSIATHLETSNSNLAHWVKSGARGGAGEFRQMVGMVGLNVDVTNKISPTSAKRSFSEGLSPIDFHVQSLGARRGIVNTYTSVREPGAFAKELNMIGSDMLITEHDCGTTRGRTLPIGSSDALDRCMAQAVSGVGAHNDIVTPLVQEMGTRHHVGSLLVRSPLTCEAKEGVCALCYGLNENGDIPPVGEHVGIRAAQAITEPLTQIALNSKHSGGQLSHAKAPHRQIIDFLHAPKILAGSAVLARRDGAVSAITESPAGGFHVTVAGLGHYVGPAYQVKVRVGQVMEKGDALSDGQAHPAEVIEHKGMARGRQYFADETQRLYADNGVKGHAKIFETIARGVVNLGQVIQPGKTEHMPGELIHWNKLAPEIESAEQHHLDLGHAEGRILALGAGTLDPYTTLTAKALKQLKDQGITHVHAYAPDALVVKPVMLGTERAALHKGDWLANLGFRFIGGSFKENVATGATSTIHGWNPLPAYAYGAEFGHGPGGKF